jgi:hypothetical protein
MGSGRQRQARAASGQVKVDATGFTTVLGLAIDHEGYVYVLQNTTGNLFPTPFYRQSVARERKWRCRGNRQRIVSPHRDDVRTGYVSNAGFGPPPIGLGEVVRITAPPVE